MTAPGISAPDPLAAPARALADPEATAAFAAEIAARLRPGDVIALDGPMGAGKTTFVRALVGALGGDAQAVASPSYTLLHDYPARLRVVHVDAWRLGGPGDLDALGFAEAAADGVGVVEWAERVAAALPAQRLWRIALDHAPVGRTAAVIPPASEAIAPAASAGAAAPALPAIIRIPGDPDDPLVRRYLADRRTSCAWQTFSWLWLLLGGLAALAGGAAGSAALGDPPPLTAPHAAWLDLVHARLGNWEGVLLGMAAGAFLSGLAGSAIGRRQVPCGQEPWYAAAALAAVYLLLYDWLICLGLVLGGVCALYAVAIGFRLLALAAGGGGGMRRAELPEPPGGWPVYTVLVPLYRERGVADSIMRSLAALDYPRDRLDVKLLLEADDPETLPAIEAAGIPPGYEVIIVPPGQPKTKPRACNHGLERARGEFLVIFDAEDHPEPDQLKQAAWAFRDCAESAPRVACLQAGLAYHNHGQNLLTRWFAIEYNVWFRRYLGGLVRLGVPIPLGGTSNHFRTAVLRDLGGWDPFNVTEDCDLGVRLHIAGWRTRILASTTWEEANSRVGNWLRQRSRWLKGYAITHLVWFRRPLWLTARLGPWATLGFLMSVLCVSLLAALNLILWITTGTYAALILWDVAHGIPLAKALAVTGELDRLALGQHLSWPLVWIGPDEDPTLSLWSVVFAIAAACLLLGNLAFVAIAALAGRRPGQSGLLVPALISPLYWVLIALGAWKGLWQLLTRPHYWEKTTHGLSD